MESKNAKKMVEADVWNPNLEEETLIEFLDYHYYPKFLNLRLNKDATTTDRESAIMFGLPSNLIEGVLVGRKIEKEELVNEVLNSETEKQGGLRKTAGPPVLVGGNIYFITGEGSVWHIYNPALKEMDSLSVSINISGQKTIKKENALKSFRGSVSERKETVIFEEEKFFSCKEFLELVNEYQDKITDLRGQESIPENNTGRQIYERLKV